MLRAKANLNFEQICDINTLITFVNNFLLGAPQKCSQGVEKKLLAKKRSKCDSCVKITNFRIPKYPPPRKSQKNRRYFFCRIPDIAPNSFQLVTLIVVKRYLTAMDIFRKRNILDPCNTDEKNWKKPISVILTEHGSDESSRSF